MTTPLERARSGRRTKAYVLRLYVSGASPRSLEAISNIKKICAQHLAGRYQLDVIDIFQEPERARANQVVAAPMLVKEVPLPLRRLTGDLSDTRRVLQNLGLIKAAADVSRRGRGREGG